MHRCHVLWKVFASTAAFNPTLLLPSPPSPAGFPCPPLTNPADHVMDVIATPPPSARGGSLAAGVRCYSTESFVLQEPPVIE